MCLSAIGTSARREQRQEEWKKGMSFANVLKQQLLHLRYEELGELYARTHGCCAFPKRLARGKCCYKQKTKA